MKAFIAECRRRRIFRLVALYFVAAWIVLQVADLAFESWGIPAATLRYVWIGAVLGFPVSLVFGWRYDIVDGRIIRTEDSDQSADLTLHRSDHLILLALSVVLVVMIYSVATEITTVRIPQTEMLGTVGLDSKSIAVLPFKNTSPDKNEASFLASGIQDDLLTRLSRIKALKVISRTSVEQYRTTAIDVRKIGRELGVSKILEGAVQRDGDNIRVNVQLIDAQTDEQTWAATYDHTLTATNVFEMQSEIAETIARQLKANLTPRETQQLSAMPTGNFAAYTAYLKGRNRADIESIESLNDALDNFNVAITLDSNFALAYVGLADAYLTLGANFRGGLSAAESNALAEPPLVKALQLDSNLGQAYATLGLLRQQQGDSEAAEQAFDQAIVLQPNYSRVFRLYGRLRWRQGRREEAMSLFQSALALDPFSAPVNYEIARSLDESGRFDEALTKYHQVVDIEPNHAFAYVYIAAIHYLVLGQADESLIWYQRAAENDALSPSVQAAQAIAYLELGDTESARKWVEIGLDLGPGTYWPVWTSLLLNQHVGDDTAAQRDARILLESDPRNWGALNLLRNADLVAGRYEVARSRYARSYRELTEQELPDVNPSNYFAAIDLALILMHLGEQERANDLLEGSLKVIETLPRLGTNGYWITDVQIYSLQQRPQRALDALQQAIDEGWRIFAWRYMEKEPNLDSIRGDARFRRLYVQIQTDLAAQAKRVKELKASGDLL